MANFISIFRIFLVFIAIGLLYVKSSVAYILAFILTVLAFCLDGLDGYIARKFNESSKLGAILDIMGDRIAEYVYWIVFQHFLLQHPLQLSPIIYTPRDSPATPIATLHTGRQTHSPGRLSRPLEAPNLTLLQTKPSASTSDIPTSSTADGEIFIQSIKSG